MNRCLIAFAAVTANVLPAFNSVQAQETEAATRQYAVAVGFQNQKLYGDAIDEWKTFLRKYPKDGRAIKARHYLGTCCLQEKLYPEAIAAFNDVIRKSPRFELMDQTQLNLGVAWYGQAQKSSSDSDYTNAERAFGQMLTKFPSSEYARLALFYRAESLFQLKQADGAAKAYAEFVRKYPNDKMAADAQYGLGTTLESLNRTKESEAAYAAFATKFPKHSLAAEVQMRRAELLFNADQFEAARPLFESVSQNRDFPLADVAMIRHARCLYEAGELSEAGRLYWSVPREFRRTKHYDAAILAGAKCYFLEGQFKLARSGLEKLAERNAPEAAEATQWLARCHLKEGNPQKAFKIADQGIRKFTGKAARPELELVRVDAMYELPSRRKQAAQQYSEFVRRNPKHELAAQAQYMAALTSLDLKKYSDAESHCDRFLNRYKNDDLTPDVLFISAESQLLLGKHRTAVEAFQKFLKADPSHANADQARVRMGLAHLMADQPAEAIQQLAPVANRLRDKTLKSEAFSVLGRSHAAQKQYEPAARMLTRAVSESPDPERRSEARIALAEAYRELDRHDDANKQLQALLKESPGSDFAAEANFRIAESAYANERFKDAIRYYTEAGRRAPDGEFAPHALYGIGWTLFNLGEYKNSANAMTQLIREHADEKISAKGYYVRAMAAYQLGEYSPVIRDVDAYLKTRPSENDALDAQYVKGLALNGLKKSKEAAETYQAILAKASNYPAADKVAYELGWTYMELERTDDAVAAFGKLATDYPKSPMAAEGLFLVGESYYDAEMFEQAAAAYADSATKAGKGEIAEKSIHKLGWSHLKSQNTGPAITAFNDQLKRFPDGELAGDAQFLIGECSFQNKDWQSARKAYERVVAAEKSNYVALAMFRAGECAASMEDWKASRDWHKRVLDNYADFNMKPEARYGYAWALQNEGQFDPAIALFEQVTEETDSETAAKARFMIGECLFGQKKHKEATRHFLKAAFLYNHKEWSAMAYFEAARCFEVLRDTEQAKNCYDQLIRKYPQHSKVADAKRRLAEL